MAEYYPIPITALAQSDDDGTNGSNIVAGAVITVQDLDGNTVIMYDDDSGSGAATSKTTSAAGQKDIYVTPGEYNVYVNGINPKRYSAGGKSALEVDTFANLELLRPVKTGQSFICQERANARYILQTSGYVALPGDVTFANGRVGKLQIDGDINVLQFGAKGDGVTDDTSVIDAVFDYAFRQREFATTSAGWDVRSYYGVYFPSGKYVYNGTSDITRRANGKVYGDGKGLTFIVLGASSYLFKLTQSPSTLEVTGITFVGGLGVYYDKGTSTVSGGVTFEQCSFFDYTQCAIGFKDAAFDRPNLNVLSCDFTGSATTNSIGIVTPGGGGHNIDDCWFNQGRIDIVTGHNYNGSEVSITRCRFGRKPAQVGLRTRIWIKTDSSSTSPANSVRLAHNHFGNENVTSNDEFILIAAGDGNADLTLEMPDRTETSEYAGAFWVLESTIEGNATYAPPLIDNYSINLNNVTIDDIYTKGTQPVSIIADHTSSNKSTLSKTTSLSYKAVNNTDIVQPSIGMPVISNNHLGTLQNAETVIHGGGYDSGFHEMLSSRNAFVNAALGGTASKTQIADSLGGTSAATFTIPDESSNARMTIPSANVVRAGEVVWVEFDAKKSATNPADYMRVQYQLSGVNVQQRRIIELTDDWVRYRFPIIQETTGSDIALAFYAFTGVSAGVNDNVDVGIPAVYRSRSPVPYYGHLRTQDSAWNTAHMILGNYHLWVDSTGDLRIKSGAPTSDTDGAVVGTQT